MYLKILMGHSRALLKAINCKHDYTHSCILYWNICGTGKCMREGGKVERQKEEGRGKGRNEGRGGGRKQGRKGGRKEENKRKRKRKGSAKPKSP